MMEKKRIYYLYLQLRNQEMLAMLKLGCVVMAAGNARRFGDNKLAARLELEEDAP